MSEKKEDQPDAIEQKKDVVNTSDVKVNKETASAQKKSSKVKSKVKKNATETVETAIETQPKQEQVKTETVPAKKRSWILVLLIAIVMAGTGYYCALQHLDKIKQKVSLLEQTVRDISVPSSTTELDFIPLAKTDFDKEYAKIEKSLTDLQAQIHQVANRVNPQVQDLLFNEVDFVLKSVQRKLLVENDVDSGIALLKIADQMLTKAVSSDAQKVRAAINQDIKQLLSLNRVDQNGIMQTLLQLTNLIDELVVLNANFVEQSQNNDQISDDINDWKANLRKSANSFLNHFIRITPRSEATAPALLAPNQDIYLRENIRLRLQIAILAVPRQQNQLYKQSLETVAAWVRSYFDTDNETTSSFLKSLDALAEQSIYIEVPAQLNSLKLLDELLNKKSEQLQKMELPSDKNLTQTKQVASQDMAELPKNKANDNAKPVVNSESEQ